MSDRRVNVLVSSAGRRVKLVDAFRSAIDEVGAVGEVYATDMSARSAAFHHADEGFLMPPCTHDEFCDAMLELCRSRDVGLVIPTIDPELAVLAANRDRFAEIGTTVNISSPATVGIGRDKARTHDWLVAAGLPTVRQAPAQEVLQDATWGLPVLVKPVAGSASIGVRVVEERAELASSDDLEDLVAQEIAPGHEHTVDLLVDRSGSLRCAVPRKRLEVRAGEVSKAVTVRDAAIDALAQRICAALPGAYGVLNVQVFVEGETMNVIEVNPRFGGGFPLSWQAGAHLPTWLLADHLGLPEPDAALCWRPGVVMLRYDDAVFVDSHSAGI